MQKQGESFPAVNDGRLTSHLLVVIFLEQRNIRHWRHFPHDTSHHLPEKVQ